MKRYIIPLLTACLFFFACEDNIKEPSSPWNPGPLEKFAVTPINGGAIITYTIPNDPDILYIMAEYERNGVIFTEKSSVHNNSLTIEGFHGEDKVEASLYKVNRQEQKSEPIVVEFEPLESLINIAQNSLQMRADFGGIALSWDNPLATELGIRLMLEDTLKTGELMTHTMHYSTVRKGTHAFRGFEPVEALFAIAIEDKWGNVSDTMSLVTTPYFETMIAKPWRDLRSTIPYDNRTLYGANYGLEKIWDGIINTDFNGYRTAAGGSGLSFTFDMQQVVKISRIQHYFYHVGSPYHHNNINEVEIWGTDKLDFDKLADLPYWLDEYSVRIGAIHGIDPEAELPERTFKDDWEYLGFHSIPRLDLTADLTAVRELAATGYPFEIPAEAKPVRYIRVFVRAASNLYPPASNNQYSMGEYVVYGDNTVPQE